MNWKRQLKEGLLTKNPVLAQLLGMCSTMAITTTLFNGIGMGLSVTIILICSNVLISLLRKVIPGSIRIAAYVVIISGFVTMVDLLLQAFVPALSESLGVFIPLIVVNCIILGRAEAFAGKNGVVASALDGLGMGVGFTAALILMGGVRELLGSGTLLGFQILPASVSPMTIFILAPGGFFVFGLLMACANRVAEHKGKPKATLGCAGCPLAETCTQAQKVSCESKGKEEKK